MYVLGCCPVIGKSESLERLEGSRPIKSYPGWEKIPEIGIKIGVLQKTVNYIVGVS